MSDDRLFASNNAIGRKWYFFNIIILAVITFLTQIIFQNFVIPNARTDAYTIIANAILYFLDLIYLITFLSLIDRRLFDAFGSREKNGYKSISSFLSFIVLFNIFYLYCLWKTPKIPIGYNDLHMLTVYLDILFLIIVIIIGFWKGKISNLSYEEYRKKSKYE